MSILKSRKWQIVLGACVIVVVVISMVLAFPKSKERIQKEQEKNDVSNKVSKNKVKELYGMSENDAINIIKKEYNDDNYEYTVVVNKEIKYEVTVKNRLTSNIDKYVVDPSTKTYYIIVE